ncbi:hypothetical protein FACS1894111_02710 [Clostridia bacterium]|nr:hypothetical protein FACS1894111_02710 [Clostridia bacterium]
MTVLEIILIAIGIIMMLGSFFVAEKLSPKEINQIAELSSAEINRIFEKNMGSVAKQVENMVDDIIDRDMDIVDRALDKETNLKLNAIHEYSDTVIETIQKSHNEVMFLYSMLNDKHKEMTEYAGKLLKLRKQLERLQEKIANTLQESDRRSEAPARGGYVREPMASSELPDFDQNQQSDPFEQMEQIERMEQMGQTPGSAKSAAVEEGEPSNQNQIILTLFEKGMSMVDIAKQLGLGLGEVKLVIELYRGEVA